MGRRGRVLVGGGVYHIINRGHNRHKLFHEFEDYMEYKEIIRSYKNRFAFELFHYCLMPNHIHLLLRIAKGQDLPHLMQGITQRYAKHHKRRYKLIGNLFQGRYKSLYIDKDGYLLEYGQSYV
ncbi:MAG: transposase [Candidatus Omnitrophota bacterium]